MKIIDAHFHLFPGVPFVDDQMRRNGHENTVEALKAYYQAHGIVGGVIMGNHTLDPDELDRGAPFYYCVGLDTGALARYSPDEMPALVE